MQQITSLGQLRGLFLFSIEVTILLRNRERKNLCTSTYTPLKQCQEMCVNIWADAFEYGSYEKFTLDTNGAPVMSDYKTL